MFMIILDCSLFFFFHISKVEIILTHFTEIVRMNLLVFGNWSDFSEVKPKLQIIEVNAER